MQKTKGLVSIIIPNHGRDLTLLIKSVDNSTYKFLELVIVDERQERSAQRNIGLHRASGEFLLILDSDQAVSPDLIQECVKYMQSGIGAVYIPEIIKIRGIFDYIRNWERQFYNGTPVDVVRFVRAENCPEFDNTMVGPEDSDWDRRVPGIRIISQAPLYHYDNVSGFTYFAKKACYSKSMSKFANKWPMDKVLDWRWRCVGVFLERGKWKRFLSRPDLALAVLGIIFLRGVIYLWKR